ncbi:MAG: DUF1294 domain-containing protein [Methylococcaceae bacterium]
MVKRQQNLVTFLLLYSGFSEADIFKCVDNNGAVTYTDQRCKNSAENVIVLKKSIPENTGVKKNSALSAMRLRLSAYFYETVFCVYVFMSILCYFFYRMDKRYAQTGQYRISEKRLHTFELLGGWPGGLIAQRTLRHKNRKLS